MERPSPSEAIIDLFEFAFDHAFGSIEKGGPLVPFGIIETGEERSLARYMDEELSAAVESGLTALRTHEPRPDRAVMVFESYINLEDEHGRCDAISVFAQEGGEGFRLGMRFKYVKKLLGTRIKLIDDMPHLFEATREPVLW